MIIFNQLKNKYLSKTLIYKGPLALTFINMFDYIFTNNASLKKHKFVYKKFISTLEFYVTTAYYLSKERDKHSSFITKFNILKGRIYQCLELTI